MLKIQRDLDFGRWFYTTSDFDQAKSWAQRTTRIRGTGKPLISCYEVNETDLIKLKTLRFETADKAWLDFITANRKGTAPADDWDLIIGLVANAQTFPTILLYLDRYIDAENAIARLHAAVKRSIHIQDRISYCVTSLYKGETGMKKNV